ncbi:MAG: hypothetical protein J6I68_15105 [Butyrivibrio sp.]|uniref:hypothetical protein n=1 Tax=Butyrivibrio sp. TaxID=28121 RepID=UPI001B46C4EB|nr:hypothetical protein [Butyrivibrio sp.]MBP3784572.1 hypothetical protein [Butyrivibrio sp.]
MLSASTNIFEYEELLMGQRTRFEASFKGTPAENKKEVGHIWRYAIEELLGWTAEEALKNLDSNIVKALMLNTTFAGLGYEPKKTYISDYRFILQYAFPESIKYDFVAETIAEYEHVAGLGMWQNDPEKYKYAKNFFSDENGISRGNILLRHIVNLYLGDMSLKEKYMFFSQDSAKAKKWIRNHYLDAPLKTYSSPLDYFHNALPPGERSDLLYNACQFRFPYEPPIKRKRRFSADSTEE